MKATKNLHEPIQFYTYSRKIKRAYSFNQITTNIQSKNKHLFNIKLCSFVPISNRIHKMFMCHKTETEYSLNQSI